MVSQPASVVVLGKFAKLFKFKHIFKNYSLQIHSFEGASFLAAKIYPNAQPREKHWKYAAHFTYWSWMRPKNGGCLLKSIYFWGIDEPNALLKGVQEVEIAIDLIAFVSGCFF